MTIGHSPDADLAWISAILAIRLPMYPKLRVQLISEFSSELVRRVMAGDLNMALVTAPPESSRITAAVFARTHLYAALPQAHAAADKEEIAFQDLAKDEWILFARRSHPVVRDAIMDAAQRQGIAPKHAHDNHRRLEMELWGKDDAFRGAVCPSFFSRSGETLLVPEQFREAATRISAAVCCIGCRHCHLLQPKANSSGVDGGNTAVAAVGPGVQA